MSPGASTTVPLAEPSLGKVWMWPPPQWSKRPGSSAKPYCVMTGYSPQSQVRSVPASLITRAVFVFA